MTIKFACIVRILYYVAAVLSRIEPEDPTAGERQSEGNILYSAVQCGLRTHHHHRTCMVIQHTQRMNTSYPRKFSTNNIICILYFNMDGESHN